MTGGVKSWSVVSALQEAGLEIAGTSVKKSTKEDKDRIKEIMGTTRMPAMSASSNWCAMPCRPCGS